MKNMMHMIAAAVAFAVAVPAMAEVVAVVNTANSQASMTKDEVANVFTGKSSALTPVDQPESAPVRAEFYKKVADKDMSQAKALWAKLVFTGKATMPKEAADSAAVKKAVAANPKAIGYIEKSAVDATVKVVFTAP
jgi:ABC-type phosphate transport system substrate-binding protein